MIELNKSTPTIQGEVPRLNTQLELFSTEPATCQACSPGQPLNSRDQPDMKVATKKEAPGRRLSKYLSLLNLFAFFTAPLSQHIFGFAGGNLTRAEAKSQSNGQCQRSQQQPKG